MERPPNPFQPEAGKLLELDPLKILEVFTVEEIRQVDQYQRDHHDNPELLFYEPLPPNFAPDRSDAHAALTHNGYVRYFAENTKKAFAEDPTAKSLRRELADPRKHAHIRAETQRALRTRGIIVACIEYIENREGTVEPTEETEPV
jgi:hypothetical protein